SPPLRGREVGGEETALSPLLRFGERGKNRTVSTGASSTHPNILLVEWREGQGINNHLPPPPLHSLLVHAGSRRRKPPGPSGRWPPPGQRSARTVRLPADVPSRQEGSRPACPGRW